jgi:hypothetical protein
MPKRPKGLSIYQRRGRWYVYYRENGRPLVKGFEGSRDELEDLITGDDFQIEYAAITGEPRAKGYGTFAGLVEFYKTKDKWLRLADTTQRSYQRVLDWVAFKDIFQENVRDISRFEIIRLRDTSAVEKSPKFSNDLLSVVSSVFTCGIKYTYGGLEENPARSIERLHRNVSFTVKPSTESERLRRAHAVVYGRLWGSNYWRPRGKSEDYERLISMHAEHDGIRFKRIIVPSSLLAKAFDLHQAVPSGSESEKHAKMKLVAERFLLEMGHCDTCQEFPFNGGHVDVATSSGNIFIECGNTDPRRIIDIFQKKDAIGFLVPYSRQNDKALFSDEEPMHFYKFGKST